MNTRFPLSFKILSWALLNILLAAVIFALFYNLRYGLGIDTLFGMNTKKRIVELAQIVANELNAKPQSEWNNVLENFSDVYEANFFLFRCNGAQVAGKAIALPAPVIERLSSIRGGMGMGQGRGAVHGAMRASERALQEPLYFYCRDSKGGGHWLGIRLFSVERASPQGGGLALLVKIDSIFKSSLFDVQPLLIAFAGAIFVSLILWVPFLRNLTKSIKETTIATERISDGDFTIRINTRRNDEIGLLARSVNKLAERLEGFITGQRRFLGDISHELCSPIARIEMALGILEQKLAGDQAQYIRDIRDDLSQMSNLVNELLAYAKIGIKQREVALSEVKLIEIVKDAIKREATPNVAIETDVPENLTALAKPELLTKAIANLIRNAIQYAGRFGPVKISARGEDEHVVISVEDHGPGVPEDELQRIFDPFYRVEKSRSREHGGAGLGLAIVKAAIQTCKGSVVARNRSPHGLCVEIRLLRR